MTFLELQELCSYWLDDLNFGYFTRTQVKRWLNNAQRECQKQLIQAGENWYTSFVTTTMVANQSDYELPDDFLKVMRLYVAMQGSYPNETMQVLMPITINQQDNYPQGPATPCAYYLKQDRLVLCPAPDSALPLKLMYAYRVADMVNDNDTPDAPEQYHEYIAVLATLDGFFKDNRDPSSFLEKKRYYLEMMKQDAQQRKIDFARSVNVQSGDGWGIVF